MAPAFQVFIGNADAALQFVKRENLDRNHYSESQRAMVGARLKSLFEEQAKQRQKAVGGDKKSYEAIVTTELKSVPVNLPASSDKGDSRDKAADAVGVYSSQW